MTDKRGKWSNEAKDRIWEQYAQLATLHFYPKTFQYIYSYEKEELKQSAPCPWCGQKMIRKHYQGIVPDGIYSWNIDHWNENPNDNRPLNLVPMHPDCNREKAHYNNKW